MLYLDTVENAMPVTLGLFFLTVVLGVVLGFLIWGRWRKEANRLASALEALQAKHDELKADHQALVEKKEQLDKDLTRVRATVNRIETENIKLHAKLEELQAES